MRLRLHSDPSGFLAVCLGHSKKLLSFTPITKLQFEEYLATRTDLGDEWYSDLLILSPRLSWRAFPGVPLLPLLMTGVWPHEISSYTDWLNGRLGRLTRLPTVSEWQQVYRAAEQKRVSLADIQQLDALDLKPAARHVQSALLREAHCRKQTWAHAMRMKGGGFDYVACSSGYLALGAPGHVLNPLKDSPRSVPPDRDPLFGFRLVYELR